MNVSEMANYIAMRIERINASRDWPVGLYVMGKDLYIKRAKDTNLDDELVWAIPYDVVKDGFTQFQWTTLMKKLDALRKAGKI